MTEFIEVKVVYPHLCKILIPKKVLDEMERLVSYDSLSAFITEALRGELKKIRFRKDMAKASHRVF